MRFHSITLLWALVFLCSIAVAQDHAAHPLPLMWGFTLDPQISLGHVGIAISVCVQIGRWGRRAMKYLHDVVEHAAQVPKIIERLDRIEDRVGLPPLLR